MPVDAFSFPDNAVFEGELTVKRSPRTYDTGVSFDNGLIVSDGFGNLIASSFLGTGSSGAFTVANWVGFGADPNGVKDSTSAMQNACDSLVASGGGLSYGPPGLYKTSGTIVRNVDNLNILGSGWGTVIKPVSGANFDVISDPIPSVLGANGFVRNFCGVRDLLIDCSQMSGITAGQGNAIHLYGSRYGHISNVFINKCPNWAILSDGDNTAPGKNFGYDNIFYKCVFDLCSANTRTVNSEANDIVACRYKWCGGATAAPQPVFGSQDTAGMHIRCDGGYMYIAGNILGKGGTYTTEAIRLSNSGPCRIIGNRFDQVLYQAVTLNGGNHMFAFNQIGSASSAGSTNAIQIGSSNNIIIGNKFDNSAGAIHYSWAIGESGGPFTGNVIIGNNLLPGTSGTIITHAASTHEIWGNVGYHDEVPGANISAVNTTYGCVDSDNVVLTDSTSAAFTVTLPNARHGYLLTIKDSTGQATAHNITLNTLAGATIDGGASGTVKITTNYGLVRLISDGTNWFTC
jgi:hypothetical protein